MCTEIDMISLTLTGIVVLQIRSNMCFALKIVVKGKNNM